jgi:hypothetical protein
MIDLSVLILQSCCLYFYLFIFNCSVSLHVYRIYMISIIHMLYVLMIYIVMDIFDVMINYLLYVIIIILIYGIKMIRKMPIFLILVGLTWPSFIRSDDPIKGTLTQIVVPYGLDARRRSSLTCSGTPKTSDLTHWSDTLLFKGSDD